MTAAVADPDVELVCLAFAVITETSEDILGVPSDKEEMRYIAGAILNRVAAGYHGRTVREVVLARAQFSRFLEHPARQALEQDDPAQAVEALVETDRRYSPQLYQEALLVAADVLGGANPWRDGTVQDERGPRVLHYWSPRSMRPAGSHPRWWVPTPAWEAEHEVIVPGLDRDRFRWGAGVP